MQFNLCYKTYEYKVTLGAMRKFKEATGKCLWSFLLGYYNRFNHPDLAKMSVVELCASLSDYADFFDVSHALHSIVSSPSVSLDEIQDGMFHAGTLPSKREDDNAEPWCIVLAGVAGKFIASTQEMQKLKKTEADS